MYSFISSFKFFKIIFIYLVVFVSLLLCREYFVRNIRAQSWQRIVNTRVQIKNDIKKDKDVLVILGTSRCKDALRPTIVSEGLQVNASNQAISGISTIAQLRKFCEKFSNSPDLVKLPDYFLLFVEPAIYNRIMYERLLPPSKSISTPKDKLKAPIIESIGAKFYSRLKFINNKNKIIQDDINHRVEDVLYKHIQASSPSKRVKLNEWIAFFKRLFIYSRMGNLNLKTLRYIYITYSFNGGNSVWVVNVERDGGYIGWELYSNNTRFARLELFASHVASYRDHVINPKNLNFEYTEQFIKDIVFLKSRGVKIILLRLPIYITLYDLENKIVPDFDDKMNAVSEVAGVKYINLNNNEMKFMTHNENAYYDASHMVNSATEAFNKKLCSILKDNGFKTKARELTK